MLRWKFVHILLRCCWVAIYTHIMFTLRSRQADLLQVFHRRCITGVVVNGDKLSPANNTGNKHKVANISTNFHKKFEIASIGYSGRGPAGSWKKPEVENLVSASLKRGIVFVQASLIRDFTREIFEIFASVSSTLYYRSDRWARTAAHSPEGYLNSLASPVLLSNNLAW
jgi:hypothetical protein